MLGLWTFPWTISKTIMQTDNSVLVLWKSGNCSETYYIGRDNIFCTYSVCMYVCMYAYLCLCIKVKRTRASWENTPLEAQTILRQKHTQKQPHVTEHKKRHLIHTDGQTTSRSRHSQLFFFHWRAERRRQNTVARAAWFPRTWGRNTHTLGSAVEKTREQDFVSPP